jgi:hypothetical protein
MTLAAITIYTSMLRRKHTIKKDLTYTECKCGLDSTGSGRGPVFFHENGNEFSGSKKRNLSTISFSLPLSLLQFVSSRKKPENTGVK